MRKFRLLARPTHCLDHRLVTHETSELRHVPLALFPWLLEVTTALGDRSRAHSTGPAVRTD